MVVGAQLCDLGAQAFEGGPVVGGASFGGGLLGFGPGRRGMGLAGLLLGGQDLGGGVTTGGVGGLLGGRNPLVGGGLGLLDLAAGLGVAFGQNPVAFGLDGAPVLLGIGCDSGNLRGGLVPNSLGLLQRGAFGGEGLLESGLLFGDARFGVGGDPGNGRGGLGAQLLELAQPPGVQRPDETTTSAPARAGVGPDPSPDLPGKPPLPGYRPARTGPRSSDLVHQFKALDHRHQHAGRTHTVSSPEALMTTKHRLTRRQRLALTGAALRGVLTGATHALLSWLLDNLT